jgi:hypothetical protein
MNIYKFWIAHVFCVLTFTNMTMSETSNITSKNFQILVSKTDVGMNICP